MKERRRYEDATKLFNKFPSILKKVPAERKMLVRKKM
jgi:hypothetical protein